MRDHGVMEGNGRASGGYALIARALDGGGRRGKHVKEGLVGSAKWCFGRRWVILVLGRRVSAIVNVAAHYGGRWKM